MSVCTIMMHMEFAMIDPIRPIGRRPCMLPRIPANETKICKHTATLIMRILLKIECEMISEVEPFRSKLIRRTRSGEKETNTKSRARKHERTCEYEKQIATVMAEYVPEIQNIAGTIPTPTIKYLVAYETAATQSNSSTKKARKICARANVLMTLDCDGTQQRPIPCSDLLNAACAS